MSSSILRAIVARGGFNPLTDIPSAAYWDMHTPDAAYETLPGNTLATAQNDGIGAVLDIKRYKERGPELVVNGDFNSADGWTLGSGWSIASGKATRVAAASPSVLSRPFSDTAGMLYEVTAEIVSVNPGSGSVSIRFSGGTEIRGPNITTAGTATFLCAGNGTNSALWIATNSTDAEVEVESLSIREIPGYHAIQSLATAQPVLNIEGGIRSALFDGVDDRLVIPNSAGAFNFLHDGTGGEFHWCGRVSTLDIVRYLFGNANLNRNGCIASVAPNGSVGVSIGNASGTYAASYTAPAGTLAVGEIAALGFSLTADTLTLFKNGQVIGSASVAGVLSSGDPEYDFVLGFWNPTNGSFNGDMYSWVPVQGILTDYQRQRLASYMLRRAGA